MYTEHALALVYSHMHDHIYMKKVGTVYSIQVNFN